MTKYPNNSVGVLAPWIYKMLNIVETGYKCIYLFYVLELSSQFVTDGTFGFGQKLALSHFLRAQAQF